MVEVIAKVDAGQRFGQVLHAAVEFVAERNPREPAGVVEAEQLIERAAQLDMEDVVRKEGEVAVEGWREGDGFEVDGKVLSLT